MDEKADRQVVHDLEQKNWKRDETFGQKLGGDG